LPSVNSAEVMTAPTQTSRQVTRASGSILNMHANSPAITTNETIAFAIWSTADSVGHSWPNQWPNAARPALATSDTNSTNPVPSTIANEASCWRTITRKPLRRGTTSQMRSSELCSWANTPVAPIINITTPTTVAITPELGRRALWTASSSVRAPSAPISPRN